MDNLIGNVGYVIGGSLNDGIQVRLSVPATDLSVGSFVTTKCRGKKFYGLVTDLRMGATNNEFADPSMMYLSTQSRQILTQKAIYSDAEVYLTLMVDVGPDDEEGFLEWSEKVDNGDITPAIRPVKTIPIQHSAVVPATAGDVAEIFTGDFVIGDTLELGHAVRIDLKKLVQRSSGIFGATGTGKSFLTRIVMAGVMKHNVASALVFDMHNEYGFDDLDSDRGETVPGLKTLLGSARVKNAAVGNGTTIRGNNPDFTLNIPASAITPKDILMLSGVLGLNESAGNVLHAVSRAYRSNWFEKFMELVPGKTEFDDEGRNVPTHDSVEGWAEHNNVHPASANALWRKLQPIWTKDYVKTGEFNPVADLVNYLETGRHVIVSFGKYETDLDYLLIANILTRCVRDRWVYLTDQHKSHGADSPRPLQIVVEEAHKLLNPAMAKSTSFGIIARELRKYFVTLLVVDQRPSEIDPEIMSQIGTRVTGWLGDDSDTQAVLSGLAGRNKLRAMLASLADKGEVLLVGWGVRMPITIKTRWYDDEFFKEMKEGGRKKESDSSGDDQLPSSFDLFG